MVPPAPDDRGDQDELGSLDQRRVLGSVSNPLATDVPQRRRLDGRTVIRWFGLLCLMGAAFFGGYVAWLLWGTGLQTQRAQEALRPGIEGQIADPGRPPKARDRDRRSSLEAPTP